MVKAEERDPFKHLFVICTAIVAVLLNGFVLVIGGGFVLGWELMFSYPDALRSLFTIAVALWMLITGLSNFIIMAQVFGFRDRAGRRVFKVAGVLNGVLILFSAVLAMNDAGLDEAGLIFAPAAITLIAICVGRTKLIPAGHCQTCGYDLAGLEGKIGGLEGGICPECGAAITHAVPDSAA